MAEGHVARPLEKKEGRTAMRGRSPQAKGRLGRAGGRGPPLLEAASRAV